MKKLIGVLVSAALVLGTLTGCGSQEEGKKVIKVAASATPHAEILEQVKPILEKEGWDLQVTVFDDYVQPNMVVDSGEFDANYFQHQAYLDDFNAENGTKLVSVAKVHYEPLGIYTGTETDLANISEGATIAVPNDPTNEARALNLLAANGLITLKEGADLKATVKDIVENPKNIQIQELEAAQITRVREEVAFIVLNGNYALQVGLSASKDAVAFEDEESIAATLYPNVIAVHEDKQEDEGIQALVNALFSQEITDFMNEKYEGAVVSLGK